MKEKIAAISILVNGVLAGGKIAVGIFSGSAAVLAEGIHSFMDIFSSLVSYVGIKISQKPADERHPYGHYKFEALAGTIITIILLITGVGIIHEAYQGFLKHEELSIGYLALGVMFFSALVNEIMARIKIYYGKKENSISLLSDGFHSRADVYASLAVFIGLLLTRYWVYTDSFLAFIIGLYIIKKSFSLGKEAIDSLLDVSAGEEVENNIKKIALEQNIQISSLKTQKKGSAVIADLEIKLPENLRVDEVAKISDTLKERLVQEIQDLQYIFIQIASHKVETSFYKPEFEKGFGWQKRGKFKGEIEGARGEGLDGYCFCPKCGYKVDHERGVPCSNLKCPKCKINLTRE